MPDFSFIVPAFNEEELLPGTLGNLNSIISALEGKLSGEVIVVDNNSSDATAEIASAEGAVVVFEPENKISRARNAGAERSESEFLIFVDADTKPSLELVENSLRLLSEGGVCGGGADVEFDAPLPFFGKLVLHAWRFYSRVFNTAAGSYIFCPRDAWRETGGFDETLYASEEIDFSKKVAAWGRKRKTRFERSAGTVVTSARKLEWHSPFAAFLTVAVSAVIPPLLKNKRWCRKLWYSRPDEDAERRSGKTTTK